MIIKNASVSRLAVFDECSLKYRYRYHDKIESPLPEPSYFQLGTLMHETIELFTKRNMDASTVTFQEMQSLVVEVAKGDSDFGNITSEEIRRVPGFLNNFIKLQRDIQSMMPDRRELTEWAIPEQVIASGPDHDMNDMEVGMSGFIDRLIFHRDKALIIDYKTTKISGHKKISEAAVDPQLRTYSYFVNKEFGIPAENITAMLYYLENGRRVPATFTDEDLQEQIGIIREKSLNILATPPESARATSGSHCNFCDYRTICPVKTRIDRMIGK